MENLGMNDIRQLDVLLWHILDLDIVAVQK